MLDTSTLQPWVEVISHDQGDRIHIHDPYKHEGKNLQLKVLTTIRLQAEKDKSIGGICTSLIHGSRDSIIRLDLQRSDSLPRQSPGKPGGTGSTSLVDCQDRFLRQICLRFSDAIFIFADNFHQATRELFRLVDAVEIDEAQHRGWPEFVVVVGSNGERAPSYRVRWRSRASFARSSLATWSQLGRSGGKYTRVLHTFLDRTRVWPNSSIGPTMVHDLQSTLASYSRCTRGFQTLGDIMAKMERFCMDPPVPRATESRAQYWPGNGHFVHSSLINWFHQVNGDAKTTDHIACICAQLFLRDSEFVVPETSYEELFLSYYRPICRKAWLAAIREYGNLVMEDMEPFLDRVLSYMMNQSDTHKRIELREKTVKSMKMITKTPFCSACLWDRRPLVLLECGHGICERDAWMTGWRASKLDTLVFFRTCPACDYPVNLRFRPRPLQAGYRVATCDGGGILGIVSLVGLAHVLKPLPRGLQPCHYFDIMGGTSTGAINVSALGLLKLPVDECIDRFCNAARDVFCKEKGFVGFLIRLVRLFGKGAIYRSAPFLRVLRDLFGDMPVRSIGEQRVPEVVRVVIVATDRTSNLVLLRSYDKVLYLNKQTNESETVDGRFNLADAIAASCAAPFYFEPVDGLHDGAFGGGNNPSSIIAGELHELSMLPIPHMDFEASFGTGSFVEESPKHWLQRLKRGLEQAFNARALYGRYWMTLSTSERKKSYRIDPHFERAPVSLDDVSSLESMKEQTQERLSAENEPIGDGNKASLQISNTIENLRAALVATLFYGVLLSPPSFDPSSRQYSVELAIVSRWEDMASIKSELSKVLETSYFLIGRTRRRFATPLMHSVKVASLQQPLDIQLLYNERSHSISGFPISIWDMKYLQGPKSLFMDHKHGLPNGKRHLPAETERTSPSPKRQRRAL